MKITDLLYQNRNRVTFSFEFIPPKKGLTSQQLVEKLKPLMEFNPLFVDVTTHRHEIVFDDTQPKRGTTIRGFVHKKHPSSLAVCEAIRNAFHVEVMPHLLCCGFDKTETEDLLLDLNFLGYSNVMALRGDRLPTEHNFPQNEHGNNRSGDLIKQIKDLNNGITLDSTLADTKTDFCIGSAAYPEKYFGSPSLDYDITCYETVKGDSDFFICQMHFDNKIFTDFSHLMPNKPALPGIKVITNPSQLTSIPERFYVTIPEDLRVGLCEESGVEWAVQQCKDLIKGGCTHLHFYTMNSAVVCKVLEKVL